MGFIVLIGAVYRMGGTRDTGRALDSTPEQPANRAI